MSCDNCTRATAGMWGGYTAACHECAARAIARSLDAFNALSPRGTGQGQELRDLIRRALPAVPFDAAKAMVWRWWKHDHPAAAKTTDKAKTP